MPFFTNNSGRSRDITFTKNASKPIHFMAFYCTVLSRLAYFTDDNFLPAYLEMFSAEKPADSTIPLKLLTQLDEASADNILDDKEVFKDLEGLPTFTFNDVKFIDFTDYATKFNAICNTRTKHIYTPPNIKSFTGKEYTTAYISISNSNYSGYYILYDTRMPTSINVIFRGTYSVKAAQSYLHPAVVIPTYKSDKFSEKERQAYAKKLSTHPTSFGTLGGIYKILQDSLNAIVHSMLYLIDNYAPDHIKTKNRSIKVITTGHSLGGGLATLFADTWASLINDIAIYKENTLYGVFEERIVCVSIGSPRVLSLAAADDFCQKIKQKQINYTRLVNRSDPVPGLPLKSMGYSHPCSQELHYEPEYLMVNENTRSVTADHSLENKTVSPNMLDVSNPLSHVNYLYVDFLKAVAVSAFMASAVGKAHLSSHGTSEISRTKAGDSLERIVLGEFKSSTKPVIIFKMTAFDLSQIRSSTSNADGGIDPLFSELMSQMKVTTTPNKTNFDATQLHTFEGIINNEQRDAINKNSDILSRLSLDTAGPAAGGYMVRSTSKSKGLSKRFSKRRSNRPSKRRRNRPIKRRSNRPSNRRSKGRNKSRRRRGSK